MQTLSALEFLQAKSSSAASYATTIIDVRSPSEFAHSHIPNAINLAVLYD